MLLTAISTVGFVSLIEAVALYNIRHEGFTQLFQAMFLYGFIITPLLRFATKYEGIGIVNFLWNIFSTIFGFVIGIYFFKEKITNLQAIGVAISLLGISLIILTPERNS
jgi:multidrug transporter EmrE-like cation transporter